jgi:hypothetical protein
MKTISADSSEHAGAFPMVAQGSGGRFSPDGLANKPGPTLVYR